MCLGCDVVNGVVVPPGGIIYAGEYWIVNHCVSPALLRGFLIVQPKRHCEHLAELTSEEAAELGTLLQRSAAALSAVVHPMKVYVLSFGESVRHIHFWVVPRYEGIPTDGLKGLHEIVVERRWVCSDDEAARIAEQVREQFT
jgi:diadenosine tetraphosphate (Ap4A) HIT family hydrolase